MDAMPSFEEQLEKLTDQIRGWQIDGAGTQTWMRHKKNSALEGLALLEHLMTVEHSPIAESITETSVNGVLHNFANCRLCRRDIQRHENTDMDQWEDWLTIETEYRRCYGLVKP